MDGRVVVGSGRWYRRSGVAGAGQDRQLQGLLSSIPEVSGTWGKGRVIDGTLFSAVLTDDGRIAVGAVAPEALFAALKAS